MNTMTEIADELDAKLLLATLMALKKGDFTARMPSDLTGISGKIADTLNDIIETKEKMVKAVTDVSRVVGREGRLTQRAAVPNVVGGWATIISSVNTLIDDLVRPTTEMARVIGAVAKGDLSQTMALEVDGHPLKGQYLRAAHRQYNGGTAFLVLVGSDARGARSRYRGQTRWSGASERRGRYLERLDRLGQLDGG